MEVRIRGKCDNARNASVCKTLDLDMVGEISQRGWLERSQGRIGEVLNSHQVLIPLSSRTFQER